MEIIHLRNNHFTSIRKLKFKTLKKLKEKIDLALEQLKWNVDNGSFYNKNSDVGNDYLNGNMNTELIGQDLTL